MIINVLTKFNYIYFIDIQLFILNLNEVLSLKISSKYGITDGFEVKVFEKAENDLTARMYPRTDVNDHPCALIRILTDLNGLSFDSNVGIVGNVEKKTGEYWLYVSPGERQLQIRKEAFIPLIYTIPESINEYAV